MTSAPEFKDTPVDREAVAILLETAGKPSPGNLTEMNAAWDELAPRTFAADEETFNGWLDEIVSFTIMTGDSAGMLADYHTRAPVILEPTDFGVWMDPANDPAEVMAAVRAERFALA